MRKQYLPALFILLAAPAGMLFAEDAQKPQIPAWLEKVTFLGDLRYRYESIDQEDKETRNRHRVRARLGARAEINDEVQATFRIATSQGADPVSTNQTFDDGFSKKDVYWDLAFLEYKPEALQGMSVLGGKMEMPFLKVGDLIWDNDLTPEGIAARHNVSLPEEDLELSFGLGGFVPEEQSQDEDVFLYGAQISPTYKMTKDAYVMAGASYYGYQDIKGAPTLYDETDGFGNTTVEQLDDQGEPTGNLLYANGYSLWNFMAEAGFNPGIPVVFYADWVFNNDVDDNGTGYMFGTRIGKPKDPGDLEFEYNYRLLEKDASVGLFADSDIFGGGTDGRGHKFSAGVQVLKGVKFAFTYFLSELAIAEDEDTDYRRFQVDLMGKF